MPHNKDVNTIIVTDVNIIVMLGLFGSGLINSKRYTFGEIQVHPYVLRELRRWKYDENKISRFSKEFINSVIESCEKLNWTLEPIREKEKELGIKLIKGVENRLAAKKKKVLPSDEDEEYLLYAMYYRVYLATQETTLINVAKNTTQKDRLFTFKNFALNLITQKVLNEIEVKAGLSNLLKHKENLAFQDRADILEAAKKYSPKNARKRKK